MNAQAFDVVVVGGGAAGLSGALVLTRARRRVLVVDAGQPRNAPAAHLHGFLSRDGTPPADLLEAGREEILGYGGELCHDSVAGLGQTTDGFSVTLGSSRLVRSRRVLLATGVTDDLPEVPGLAARWGRDVLHCPYCHGWEVRDHPLVVLANGPLAVHQALLVRQWSSQVMLLEHETALSAQDREQLAARRIPALRGKVTGVNVEDDRLTGVTLAGGRTVPAAAVFVAPRLRVQDSVLRPLQVEVEHSPVASWVATDDTGRTSIRGIWAAGNVADPTAQVISAAGAGSRAAIAMNADLVAEDTGRAVTRYRAVRSVADPVG